MRRSPRNTHGFTVTLQAVPAEPVHAWRHLTAEESKTSSASWVCDRCHKTDHAMFYSEAEGEVCQPQPTVSARDYLKKLCDTRYTEYPLTVKKIIRLGRYTGQPKNDTRFAVIFWDGYKIQFTVTDRGWSRFTAEVTKIYR